MLQPALPGHKLGGATVFRNLDTVAVEVEEDGFWSRFLRIWIIRACWARLRSWLLTTAAGNLGIAAANIGRCRVLPSASVAGIGPSGGAGLISTATWRLRVPVPPAVSAWRAFISSAWRLIAGTPAPHSALSPRSSRSAFLRICILANQPKRFGCVGDFKRIGCSRNNFSCWIGNDFRNMQNIDLDPIDPLKTVWDGSPCYGQACLWVVFAYSNCREARISSREIVNTKYRKPTTNNSASESSNGVTTHCPNAGTGNSARQDTATYGYNISYGEPLVI